MADRVQAHKETLLNSDYNVFIVDACHSLVLVARDAALTAHCVAVLVEGTVILKIVLICVGLQSVNNVTVQCSFEALWTLHTQHFLPQTKLLTDTLTLLNWNSEFAAVAVSRLVSLCIVRYFSRSSRNQS